MTTTLEASVWFKHRAWILVASLLSVVNLAAVGLSGRPIEPMHATTHALLAVLFALGAWRLATRPGASTQSEDLRQTIDGMQAHLRELEERVDFAERVLAKQRDADRLGGPPR